MLQGNADANEALMQFLYRAPIGLVESTVDGEIEMLNPMSARLLMPLSADGNLVNLFHILESVAHAATACARRQFFAEPSGTRSPRRCAYHFRRAPAAILRRRSCRSVCSNSMRHD